jgi:WD40 repeat protein
MNVEDAINFANTLVHQQTKQYLNAIQTIIIRQLWSNPRLNYIQIASDNQYNHEYIKQVGKKLWNTLTTSLGETVSKANFKVVFERRWNLQSPPPIIDNPEYDPNFVGRESAITYQCIDWGEAPDVSIFYGRTEELTKLEQWILTDRCKLVTLLGMGGIGKTSLSVKLTEQIQSNFEYVIWRSLRNAPPLTKLLTDVIKLLSNQQETDLYETTEDKISLLIHYLRSSRCLLVIDNTETILQSGEYFGTTPLRYREGYEDYGELFRQIGELYHNSCLILTSRELLEEIARMQGVTLPVRSLQLFGMNEAAQEILISKGLIGSEKETEELIQLYRGNPLALKIVATSIQDLFNGNISEFIKQGTTVFNGIRKLLEEQFNRLSNLEKKIMYWLAISRELTFIEELRQDIIPTVSRSKLIETLEYLGRRSLIETGTGSFTQQPVVMEYMTEKFIQEICEEIKSGKINLFNTYSLIKATAKDYIRDNQIRLILKPIIDELLTIFRNKKNIENILKNFVLKMKVQEKEEPGSLLGYLYGNVINLLSHIETNLTNYDFSNMTIWQAYLKDVNLHNVNFAYSNLDKCIFAESFSSIFSVAFSPDKKLLATGDAHSEIRIWQVLNGKQLLTLKGHSIWVRSVAFSPDGSTLASGSDDKTVKIWDVYTGQCLHSLEEHTSQVRSVAFSPDGTILATGCEDLTVRLWNIDTYECVKILLHISQVRSVAFSPDGTILATGCEDLTVRLWNIQTEQCFQKLQGHTSRVWSVAFSPDGTILATGCDDKTVKIWDVHTGQCLHSFEEHTSQVRSVAFSPDGTTLASGSADKTVRLWNIQTRQRLRILQGHTNGLRAVCFSTDGITLASGGLDQTVRLWDAHTGKSLRILHGKSNAIRPLSFSPDGIMLASGSDDQILRIWNVNSGQCLKTLKGHTSLLYSLSFCANDSLLASGSDDQTVKIWNIQTGLCLLTLRKHSNAVLTVAFSPSGTTLASGGYDQTVRLWDISTGKCIETLQEHTGRVWSVAFSPDGSTLASASDDKTVRLWDISTGKCTKILQGHTSQIWSVAFSSDGTTVASGSGDQTVRLWDISTGKCTKTLQGHTSQIWSVAFSPDGNTLASGSGDQTVRLWDISTGKCTKTLQGHTSQIWSVAFSPDGNTLASSSQDETIKLWNPKTGNYLKTIKPTKPYEGMNITDTNGLTEAEKANLINLGAVDDNLKHHS